MSLPPSGQSTIDSMYCFDRGANHPRLSIVVVRESSSVASSISATDTIADEKVDFGGGGAGAGAAGGGRRAAMTIYVIDTDCVCGFVVSSLHC